MKKLEVLFLSAQPAARYFFSKFYINNPNINIGVNNYSFFDGPKNLDYNKYNIIIFDDGSLKEMELEKICYIPKENNIKKILFSGYFDKNYFRYFIKNDFDGIISKKENIEGLIDVIYLVMKNFKYYSPSILQYFRQPEASMDVVKILTKREKEIINLSHMGLQNKDIAEQLSLSIKTIESHKQNIKNKLGIDILHTPFQLKTPAIRPLKIKDKKVKIQRRP